MGTAPFVDSSIGQGVCSRSGAGFMKEDVLEQIVDDYLQ
jgi:hypothetical protein